MAYGNTVKDGSGSFYHLLVNADGEMIVDNGWDPELQSDEDTNDSDKKITVDTGEQWIVEWIWVELATDATVGNRQLVVEIQDDADDVIAQVRAGAVQAASNTYYYLFAPNVTELTAVRDSDYLSTIMPRWVLPAGYDIRVYDNNAVAAAADDMVIQMGITKRTVP